MKCKESSILPENENFDKNWNFREIFKFLFCYIYENLGKGFCIFLITFGRVDPPTSNRPSKIHKLMHLGIPHFFRKIPWGFGENLKKARGVKLTPLAFPGLMFGPTTAKVRNTEYTKYLIPSTSTVLRSNMMRLYSLTDINYIPNRSV